MKEGTSRRTADDVYVSSQMYHVLIVFYTTFFPHLFFDLFKNCLFCLVKAGEMNVYKSENTWIVTLVIARQPFLTRM